MSATKTIGKAAISRLYNPFVDAIVTATEALVAAEDVVTVSRVALGRIIGQTVAALTTAGASAEEAQARIMATIGTVTASVEWQTVQGWVRAATVADSLPDTVNADAFSTEALQTIGRVKPDDRDEFVNVVVNEGLTSVRALRDAVKAHQVATSDGKPSRAAKGTASQASDAVKAATRIIGKNPLPNQEEDPAAFLVAVMTLASDVRTKCPKFSRPAMVAAFEEIGHTILFGEADATTTDGDV